ncbi:PLDc N-terminal domain-containing protein [Brevibacillus borstelensis]|uniref:PLDc N-terminal domain-containing protein n=1 Tax=Brevibacillus borstelensis TaxID=45462 RepID=UPI003CC90D2B
MVYESSFDFPINMILFPFLVILFLYALNIVTSIWAYRDARKRGKSSEYALLVLIGTLMFPVMGLIVYFIIRNDS